MQEGKESVILRHIQSRAGAHPGSRNVALISDSFYHDGPNGRHLCLVLPAMTAPMPIRQLPERFAKEIARQALRGLECIHAVGVVHGGG